jgi:hypothetical protein
MARAIGDEDDSSTPTGAAQSGTPGQPAVARALPPPPSVARAVQRLVTAVDRVLVFGLTGGIAFCWEMLRGAAVMTQHTTFSADVRFVDSIAPLEPFLRGRAWIRLQLSRATLSGTLRTLFQHPRYLSLRYKSFAVMASGALRQELLAALDKLGSHTWAMPLSGRTFEESAVLLGNFRWHLIAPDEHPQMVWRSAMPISERREGAIKQVADIPEEVKASMVAHGLTTSRSEPHLSAHFLQVRHGSDPTDERVLDVPPSPRDRSPRSTSSATRLGLKLGLPRLLSGDQPREGNDEWAQAIEPELLDESEAFYQEHAGDLPPAMADSEAAAQSSSEPPAAEAPVAVASAAPAVVAQPAPAAAKAKKKKKKAAEEPPAAAATAAVPGEPAPFALRRCGC